MKTKLIWLKPLFFLVAFVALGCSSSSDTGGTAGSAAGGSAGNATGGSGNTLGGSSGNATGGNATGGSATGGSATGGNATGGNATGGSAGTATGGAAGSGGAGSQFVYFVAQASGAPTATLASGTISVTSTFGASGNAFKYVAPNYYGTVSNGFISFPTTMSGDFSITAQVTITAQNKANNACGIGLGMTTGFNGTDSYGYVLMRNTSNTTNGYYVSAVGAVSAGAPAVPFTNGTPLQLTFSRTGSNATFSAGTVGGTPVTNTVAASVFSNGVTAYGSGAVYPALSFNNVNATITGLVIKDGTGATVFDSATGSLVDFIPASLTLSTATTAVVKGASTAVTATALAVGGTVSPVTAVPADPTIATATVVNGATNSTITLNGLKGGVTTVTVTNTGDTNTATNTKTITLSVNDYPASDPYGSLATRAYPAPAAINAYTDGELSLTFDAPPTLNTGGSIQIYKAADGTLVDSVAFAGETQTYGTTVINVGSQLARVAGNIVYFAPHLGKLAYGTAYYVVIPTTSITGTLNAIAFNGLSNLSTVATWNFTTRAAPTLSATSITVDGSQTSTANFRTLQGALNALTTGLPGAATSATVNVAAGTYNELIHYAGPNNTAQTINIIGPANNNRGDTCTVQFANGNGMNGATLTRASFYFSGSNLVLQNITLKNTGVRSVVSQAESLYFASGAGYTVAADNSSFYSKQDTIQTSGRAWFYDCFVEGNVDFIWGTADANLVEASSLHFINDVGAAATYGLFVARTGATGAATIGKGYVLLNSTVNVDAMVTAYFGRDAGTGAFYDQAALISNTFTGTGTIGAGIWNVTTLPIALADSSYVGWKSSGNTGLNLAGLVTDTHTSATIANQATEYDNRNDILNRVVTVTAGAPSGFQAAASIWDVSGLATAWGAP